MVAQTSEEPPGESSASGPPLSMRAILVLVGVAGLVALSHAAGLADRLGDLSRFARRHASGPLGPAGFVLGSACLVAIGVPRLAFPALGTVVFGFAGGLLWSMAGTILGSYLSFLAIRVAGRKWALARIAGTRLAPLVDRRHSPAGVFAIRQVPISGGIVTAYLSISSVSHAAFLIGSCLGFLPESIAVAAVASGLASDSIVRSAAQIAGAVAAVAVLSVILARYRRVLPESARDVG